MIGYLMKLSLMAAMAALLAPALRAQSVTTNKITFSLEDVSDEFHLPDFKMDVKFFDANGNNILSAGESAELLITVTNEGGNVDHVSLTVTPEDSSSGIQVEQSHFNFALANKQSQEIKVPIKATLDVPKGNARLNIVVSEPMGYDLAACIEFPTKEFMKPELTLLDGVEIIDYGVRPIRTIGDPDNKLQNGEVVQVTMSIQNVGRGIAENVSYTLTSSNTDLTFKTPIGLAREISGQIDEIRVGEIAEIDFMLTPNAHYSHQEGYVPVFLTVKEKWDVGGIASTQLPLPFDAEARKPDPIKIEGKEEDQGTVTIDYGNKVRSPKSRYKNPNLAPLGESIYKDAVAVVIGAQDFADRDMVPAPYAANDAQIMKNYFEKSLAISDVRLMINEQQSSQELKNLFDVSRGQLKYVIKPGKTDLYVYYSGHGVPVVDKNGRNDIMLTPYDVYKNFIIDDGYSLNQLYKELSSLQAKSVTVILDACFSGSSKPSGSIPTKSVANQKVVLVDYNNMEQPWRNDPTFCVFSSSRSDQVSYACDETRTGFFTYYLAAGLQGEADVNADGKVTMKELADFVISNVDKETGGKQVPQFYGTREDFVVEKIR